MAGCLLSVWLLFLKTPGFFFKWWYFLKYMPSNRRPVIFDHCEVKKNYDMPSIFFEISFTSISCFFKTMTKWLALAARGSEPELSKQSHPMMKLTRNSKWLDQFLKEETKWRTLFNIKISDWSDWASQRYHVLILSSFYYFFPFF